MQLRPVTTETEDVSLLQTEKQFQQAWTGAPGQVLVAWGVRPVSKHEIIKLNHRKNNSYIHPDLYTAPPPPLNPLCKLTKEFSLQ